MPVARRAKPFQQGSHLRRDLWLGWGAEIGKGWRTFGPIPWLLHLGRAKFPDKGFHLRGTPAAGCLAACRGIDSAWGKGGDTLGRLGGRAHNWSHCCHYCRLLWCWNCGKPTLTASAAAPPNDLLPLLRLDPLVLEPTSRWKDLRSGSGRLLALCHKLLKARDRVGGRGTAGISSDIKWDTSSDGLIVDTVILRSRRCIISNRLLPPSSHILPKLAIQLHLLPPLDHARLSRIPEVSLSSLDIRLHTGSATACSLGRGTEEWIVTFPLLLLNFVVDFGNGFKFYSLGRLLATGASSLESGAFPEAASLILPAL